MIYGTHNSATGGKLLWWLKPLSWIINPTSKCQDKTIIDQLADGVKIFNLQVAYVNNKWRFSHGLALYKEDVIETLAMIKACATKDNPIYIQLYLDKCFWCKQNEEAFKDLIATVKSLCDDTLFLLPPWIEGTDITFYGSSGLTLSWEERYWTTSWANKNAKSWIDKLPLPKYHAKKHNKEYKEKCVKNYLMLDFYEFGE